MPRDYDEDGGAARIAKKWTLRAVILVAVAVAVKLSIVGLIAMQVLKH